MLISIITVVYNRRATLPLTLDSVAGQTHRAIEYIVIDGGSTDGTLALLEERQAEFAVLISEPDRGLYDAMNKGLDEATGDFCLFLNAGDAFYAADSLAQLVAVIDDPAVYYYGTAVMTDGEHIYRLNPWEPVPDGKYPISQGLPNHQASLFPRSFYQDERYDLSFAIAADDDYKIRALKRFPARHVDAWTVIFELGGLSRDLSHFKTVRLRRRDGELMLRKHFPDDGGRRWRATKFRAKSFLLFCMQAVTGFHWRYELYFNKFRRIPVGEQARFRSIFGG
jgi:glycosyltransferase involved in cell wall biosynthesis